MLLVLGFLIGTGYSAYSGDSAFLKELRNTNLGNLIVWSYWWPLIIFLAIFFGRFWCMVCPVELITSVSAKIGLKKTRPKFVLSGWLITIFYLIILFVGIEILAIHRNPFYMAWYLISIILVAVLIGFFFEKNTFCRYVCPVGYLLGIYSRLSFLGWRVKDKNICNACTDKLCIHKNYRYELDFKSCGVDLYPAEIESNSDCILCAGCMKSCSKNLTIGTVCRPNPQFRFIGFFKDILTVRPLAFAEMFFILIVSGFVISEILTEWKTAGAILDYIPDLISKLFELKIKQ